MHTTITTITFTSLTALALGGALAFSTSASAADRDPCGEVLARLVSAGRDLGYNINASKSGLTGTLGRKQLSASCAGDHVEIDLLDGRGGTVGVSFSSGADRAFALELHAEYPGVGSISRTAMTDDASAELTTGFLDFTAEVGAESAAVEFDLAGRVVASRGDARLVNDRFAPILKASTMWTDAHVFTFALAGIWDSGVGQHEADLDTVLDIAVPNPDPVYGVKKSVIGQALACGAATITCTATAWFPPAGGACVGQASTCALAIGCAIFSCLD